MFVRLMVLILALLSFSLTALGASTSPSDEADKLLKTGVEAYLADRNDEARSAYSKALQIYRAEKNQLGEANALTNFGNLEQTLGRNDEARKAYNNALTLYKPLGNQLGEANVLSGLGDLEKKLGRNDEARKAYNNAITLYKGMKTEQAAAEKMASSPASDEMQHLGDAWSRGDKLTAIGVIVAVLGIMAAIFSAEIKRMLQHVWSKIKPNS